MAFFNLINGEGKGKLPDNPNAQIFTVTITQSANQTITVTCNGVAYTSTFTANYGSTYTTSVSPSTEYTAGTISSDSGTITNNISISATAATSNAPTGSITVAKLTENGTVHIPTNITKISISISGKSGAILVDTDTGFNQTMGYTSGTSTTLKSTTLPVILAVTPNTNYSVYQNSDYDSSGQTGTLYTWWSLGNIWLYDTDVSNADYTISWSPSINNKTAIMTVSPS